MPTSDPLPQEAGLLAPSFAAGDDAQTALGWRQARLRALTAVRSQDWPTAWKGFELALSEIRSEDEVPFSVGLRADLSHTDWLNGHHAQALQGFALTLAKAEALSDPQLRDRLMAVIALVLAGFNQELAGDPVPAGDRLWPGTCSDPAFWPEQPTPPALAWLQLLRLEERLGQSDLFHEHGGKTAHAANPLIRWYHQQLAIRKVVRDDTPALLMPALLACGRALRAVHESADPGISTVADRPDPLDLETLATAVLPPLLACLILQQGGLDLIQIVEGWAAEVAAPSPETVLHDWLQGVLALMCLRPDQAWELTRDPEQAYDSRLVTGLRVLSAEADPDRLFFVHCLVVLWAARPDASLGANLLETWFPEMVRRAWIMMAKLHPDLQAQPDTSQALMQACLAPAPGWAGVRQILQTIQPAAHVTLGLPVLAAFQTLIGGQMADETVDAVYEPPSAPAAEP
jgi:hypothetical protein